MSRTTRGRLARTAIIAAGVAVTTVMPPAAWAEGGAPAAGAKTQKAAAEVQKGPEAQKGAEAQKSAAEAQKGSTLLTIFLRHDQSKTLDEINEHLRKTGYYKKFPPPGVEVLSWYVMMGVGQVVTLRVPAERLREVNRVIEESAWGGYRTEFYPTYDYKAIGQAQHDAANR